MIMMEIDAREKELKRALKRSFRGRRSLAAVLLDRVFWAFICFSTLYLLIRPRYANRTIAVIVTAASFLAISVLAAAVGKSLYGRHVKKLYETTKEELEELRLLERLEELNAGIDCERGEYAAESLEAVTADDVIRAALMGGRVKLIAAGQPTEKAKRLLSLYGGRIELVHPRERFADELNETPEVTDERIQEAIIEKYRERRPKRMKPKDFMEAVKRRPFAYLAAGAGLFILSFFSKSALYLRLFSSICFGIGAAAVVVPALNNRANEKPDA